MASIEYVKPVTLTRAVADWSNHGQRQAGACGNQHIKMSVAASVGVGVGSVLLVNGLGEAVGVGQKRTS